MTHTEWERLHFAAQRLTTSQLGALDRLAIAIPKLGPRALQLLVETAEGLELGVSYGDWGPGRDRVAEGRAEARDGGLYVLDELDRAEARVAALRRARAAFAAAHDALSMADTYPPPAEPLHAGG
jgi:hypothetical protein